MYHYVTEHNHTYSHHRVYYTERPKAALSQCKINQSHFDLIKNIPTTFN